MNLFFVLLVTLFSNFQVRAEGGSSSFSPKAWETRINLSLLSLEPALSHYLSLARTPHPRGQAALLAGKCKITISMLATGLEAIPNYFRSDREAMMASWNETEMTNYLAPSFDVVLERLPAASATLYYLNEIVRYTAEYQQLLSATPRRSLPGRALRYSYQFPLGVDPIQYWGWTAQAGIDDVGYANALLSERKTPGGVANVVRIYLTARREGGMPPHPHFDRLFTAVVGLTTPERLPPRLAAMRPN